MAHRLPETNGPTPTATSSPKPRLPTSTKPPFTVPAKLGGRVIDSKGKFASGNQWLLAEQAAELEEPAEEEEDPVNV